MKSLTLRRSMMCVRFECAICNGTHEKTEIPWSLFTEDNQPVCEQCADPVYVLAKNQLNAIEEGFARIQYAKFNNIGEIESYV